MTVQFPELPAHRSEAWLPWAQAVHTAAKRAAETLSPVYVENAQGQYVPAALYAGTKDPGTLSPAPSGDYAHFDITAAAAAAAAGGMTLDMVQPKPAVGEWVSLWTTNNNHAEMWSDGDVVFGVMPLPAGTYDAASIGLSGGGVGAKVRFGVYANDGSPVPGGLLAQTAALPAEGSAYTQVTGLFDAPIVIPAGGGSVWVGVVSQSNGATRPGTQRIQGYAPQPLFVSQTFFTDAHYSMAWGPFYRGLTGAFPATLPAAEPRSVFHEGRPKFRLRRSA